jgi:hypothetical protein
VSRTRAALFLAACVGAVVLANAAVERWRPEGLEPPEYAAWSGVQQLERKMRLLRDFARAGPVDALVLGSSMADMGVCAQVLGQELSAHLGRPYRVFNFAMGGADLTTYANLYRLARVVAQPREIWIVSPVSGPALVIEPGSLDHQLERGPLARLLDSPALLGLSHRLHEVALVRHAPALRDRALHLAFARRPASNLDLYAIDAAGDTLSWVYNPPLYDSQSAKRAQRRAQLMTFLDFPEAAPGAHLEKVYFAPRTLAALRDLKALAERDSIAVRLVPFDIAVGLGNREPRYLEASRRFFEPLARLLGGAAIADVRESFVLQPYMVADAVHLNSLGARAFSALLAARVAGRPLASPPAPVAEDRIARRLPDAQWTPFTALIAKRSGEPSATLRLTYLEGWGVRRLPPSTNVRVAVRMADGQEATLPARVLRAGEVVADSSRLPLGALDQVIATQLLVSSGRMGDGVLSPLASYEWSHERPAIDFSAIQSSAEVSAGEGPHSATAPLAVSWSRLRAPAARDWIGIVPAGGDTMERVAFRYTGGRGEGTLRFDPPLPAGRYEARLYRNDSLELVAASPAFALEAVRARLELRTPLARAGGAMRVAWTALNFPHPKDWIGLFAADGSAGSHSTLPTGGAAAGEIELPLTNVRPGDYELRLYSAGGWTQAGALPVRVHPTNRPG